MLETYVVGFGHCWKTFTIGCFSPSLSGEFSDKACPSVLTGIGGDTHKISKDIMLAHTLYFLVVGFHQWSWKQSYRRLIKSDYNSMIQVTMVNHGSVKGKVVCSRNHVFFLNLQSKRRRGGTSLKSRPASWWQVEAFYFNLILDTTS